MTLHGYHATMVIIIFAFRAREAVQAKVANCLTQQINKFSTSAEVSLLAAAEQDNTKWNQRVESEARKKQEALDAIEAYRISVLQAKEDLKARQMKETKEDLRRLLELDEKTRREDEERKARHLQENRELAQNYLDEMANKSLSMNIYIDFFQIRIDFLL